MLSPNLTELPPTVRNVVQNELQHGEKLIWVAQPVYRFATAGNIVPMVFAFPFTGIALAFVIGSFVGTRMADAPGGLQVCFPLFGLPFIVVGLLMLTAPFWNRRAYAGTVYLVTDRRAVICAPGFFGGRKTDSFDPVRLTAMQRIECNDGSGDLIFEQFTTHRGSGTQTVRRGFMSVPRVHEVEEMLRNTLLASRVRTIEPPDLPGRSI